MIAGRTASIFLFYDANNVAILSIPAAGCLRALFIWYFPVLIKNRAYG